MQKARNALSFNWLPATVKPEPKAGAAKTAGQTAKNPANFAEQAVSAGYRIAKI
ncbi:hypothetical protein [Glycocaulis sp.]|uniref:hypothetical protein n=1 Tax=Glycocaulis sp. TaxID=1969725 RepID=UPI003D23BDE2